MFVVVAALPRTLVTIGIKTAITITHCSTGTASLTNSALKIGIGDGDGDKQIGQSPSQDLPRFKMCALRLLE